ncbi:E3 ubiquitin-protein ligase RDUF1-like [Phragmites australis]|uniref:E3 ubiquitin-protein ligase RDUF1-like n=1 Tax=Phragmites australis TaxID=29695 RepID=UPI002D76DD2B|nr:E3 ubiquitin-protein ligase RDUF1-like [Phragmites australis]
MTDGRRPDGSYGLEYGPLPPEHEYALHRHLPSRGRAPWPLHYHGDYPGRLLDQRLRREPFGFPRHPLQPYVPFRIHHVNGGGGGVATVNPRRRRESPGLSNEEFRKAIDQLSKQEYRPSNPQKKRGGRGTLQTRSARAEAPAAVTEEEKSCTICLETFLPGEQVLVTPCNHMFHQGCITPWVKWHGNCPLCRFALCERRNTVAGDINSSNGEDGRVDLDVMARAMEESLSRVRLSDLMSYH